MIRVGIVDDQSIMREGLRTILNNYEDINVVALGKDGREAVDICMKYNIDVLLLDIRMPNMTGVEAVREIKRLNKDVHIIMLTTFDDEEYIVDALGYGAKGYIFKDIEYEKLVDSIRDVKNNQFIMPPKVAQVLANRILNKNDKKSELDKFDFTARELEIVDMIKDGFTNKQISLALCISEGTVKNYVSSIYSKTDIRDRSKLTAFLKETL